MESTRWRTDAMLAPEIEGAGDGVTRPMAAAPEKSEEVVVAVEGVKADDGVAVEEGVHRCCARSR